MKLQLTFDKGYFQLALLLFLAEVFIGRNMHDSIIRPFGGDFLVVIFIYSLIKGFFNTRVYPTAFGVLIFAWAVEVSQYFHLVNLLGPGHSTTARLLLGTTFSFVDLLVYALGILLVIIVEQARSSLKNS